MNPSIRCVAFHLISTWLLAPARHRWIVRTRRGWRSDDAGAAGTVSAQSGVHASLLATRCGVAATLGPAATEGEMSRHLLPLPTAPRHRPPLSVRRTTCATHHDPALSAAAAAAAAVESAAAGSSPLID